MARLDRSAVYRPFSPRLFCDFALGGVEVKPEGLSERSSVVTTLTLSRSIVLIDHGPADDFILEWRRNWTAADFRTV
jgi:hypothetical protein